MQEDLIAFIWKHQYVKKEDLKTTTGEGIQILKVGEENTNAGPDFFNAQMIIGNQKWAGTVELHVKSSDWYVHGHEKDVNYDNVILHVVWEHNAPVFRKNGAAIPTLALSKYINTTLLYNYKKLFSKKPKWINCERDIASVDRFILNKWLEQLYVERLEQKTDVILGLLQKSNSDWEAVLFQMLAKNFGLKVNGTAFFELAQQLDFSIVRKELDDCTNCEALLLGQAGLLNDTVENGYFNSLKAIYNYQFKKYRLKTPVQSVQFFRLRPNNFPTIRLAQLANLYVTHKNLFAKIVEAQTVADYYELFNITASDFWDRHYTFNATSAKRAKKITTSFIDLLLINTVIPIRFVYLKSLGKPGKTNSIEILSQLKPEKNAIVEKFSELGIISNSAYKTQALLQLKNKYCKPFLCLKCSVGDSLLTKR